MHVKRLNSIVKVASAVVPSAGAAQAMTPVEVNCTGYDRVMYVLYTGAAAAGATIAFKIQDAATSGGALADLSGAASAGLTKAANENKIHIYDVPVNSARPYQKVTGEVGTDTFANSVVAVLYKANAGAGYAYPVATTYATELVVA